MKIEPTALPGVLLIRPQVFGDDRGFFMETYHEAKLAAQGLRERFVQDNLSRSVKGALRGLHFQHPHGQGKLVRAVAGAVYDVAVDVRRGSPTFGRWIAQELSAENKLALYIPPGFAHGFCVITETAEFFYKCTEFYAPQHERGILWNDPDIAINWPVRNPILSAKDGRYPRLASLSEELPPYQAGA